MNTVMLFYGGMALVIGILFYFGYRVNKKNAWRREEHQSEHENPLDPNNL